MPETKTPRVSDFPKTSVAKMNTEEREQFGAKCVAKYALMEQLIEFSNEPPCPHALENRVNTDFPSQCWGTIMVRLGELMEVPDMRVEREQESWMSKKSMGHYYRSDYFYALSPLVSTLIARKARKGRAAIEPRDISDSELVDIISQSGLMTNSNAPAHQ